MTTTTLLAKGTLAILLLLIPLATLRILAILPSQRPKPAPRKRGGTKTHLLIVLGSGGHTAEMTAMLRNAVRGRTGDDGGKLLDWRDYTHRTWIVSSGDGFSAARARELEGEFEAFYAATSGRASEKQMNKEKKQKEAGTYDVVTVPRARRIHQPLLTAPLSSLRCLWACLVVLCRSPHDLPDLVLTNGPATAAIVVLATLLLRFADVRGANSRGKCRTVYVESWARVKKLSLSGRLLCYGAERVLVQWERLQGVGGRGEYLGVLV